MAMGKFDVGWSRWMYIDILYILSVAWCLYSSFEDLKVVLA